MSSHELWRATNTTAGPATVRLVQGPDGLTITGWGPGAAAAVEQAPELVGLHDTDRHFSPRHPLVAALARRHDGLRVGRSANVVESLLPAVCEQKVTSIEAHRTYSRLVRALGTLAPGPAGLVVPPDAATLARTPSWIFHRAGLERRRAEALVGACLRAPRLEECLAMSCADAQDRLRAFPGIGPWTAAEVAGTALGDPDAVPVGDFHLPNTVSWALAREPRADDRRMLELLEPYAGHRRRVLRLLAVGAGHAPRWGPRLSPADISQH